MKSLLRSAACASALALLTSASAEDKTIPNPPDQSRPAPAQSSSERLSERQTRRDAERAVTDQKNADTTTATPDADNTRRNQRDRDNDTLTPGDQGNTKADMEVTRQIRRALVKDKSLSTTAKNIKIITKDGKVTLRGPVKTDAEKQAIVAKAKEIATTAHPVTDELEVKSKSKVNAQYKSVEPEARTKE